MDINSTFNFWVTNIEPIVGGAWLIGFTFDGTKCGLNVGSADLAEAIWIIESGNRKRLDGELQLTHVGQSGWRVGILGDPVLPLPCLLTSNSSMSCVYNGPVEVAPAGIVDEATTLIGEFMPLVGEKWIGIISNNGGKIGLIAYSDLGEEALGSESKAYYPEWSNGLEDSEGFHIWVRKQVAGRAAMNRPVPK